MSSHDNLGDRMKTYEGVSKGYLVRRMPVIIRLDGKAFHSFTRGLDKPFDNVLVRVMQKTMQYLCQNIQGCVFGYTQSDEISLILVDYATVTTDAWFGYGVQKMASISASMATLAFNKFWSEEYCSSYDRATDYGLDDCPEKSDCEYTRYRVLYSKRMQAMFDSRVFNVPKEDVVNYFVWRQQDAIRNSIQAVGQSNFSHRDLMNKSCEQIKEMLLETYGIEWDNYPVVCKRGTSCVKVLMEVPCCNDGSETILRAKWSLDTETPIFSDDRAYIQNLVSIAD